MGMRNETTEGQGSSPDSAPAEHPPSTGTSPGAVTERRDQVRGPEPIDHETTDTPTAAPSVETLGGAVPVGGHGAMTAYGYIASPPGSAPASAAGTEGPGDDDAAPGAVEQASMGWPPEANSVTLIARAPATTAGGPAQRPIHRRTSTWIAVAAAFVIVAISVVAFVAYQQGQDWKHIATTRGESLTAAKARLVDSEADAADLQSRLDDLANEKAQAEDDRNAAEQERDGFKALALLAAAAADDMALCNDATNTMISALVDELGYTYPDFTRVESLATTADTVCNKATTSYNTFVDAVNAA